MLMQLSGKMIVMIVIVITLYTIVPQNRVEQSVFTLMECLMILVKISNPLMDVTPVVVKMVLTPVKPTLLFVITMEFLTAPEIFGLMLPLKEQIVLIVIVM